VNQNRTITRDTGGYLQVKLRVGGPHQLNVVCAPTTTPVRRAATLRAGT
jgi:hypothetical protein